MLLPYHILVQTCLDLVGRGNIPDVQYGLGILLFLLFLDLLLVRDTALSLQIRYVYKTDIGHAVALQHIVHILLELGITEHALIVELAHRVHSLVHTVVADTDIVGPQGAKRPRIFPEGAFFFAYFLFERKKESKSLSPCT